MSITFESIDRFPKFKNSQKAFFDCDLPAEVRAACRRYLRRLQHCRPLHYYVSTKFLWFMKKNFYGFGGPDWTSHGDWGSAWTPIPIRLPSGEVKIDIINLPFMLCCYCLLEEYVLFSSQIERSTVILGHN